MKEFTRKAESGKNLSIDEAHSAMLAILDYASDKEIYDFLIAMNKKEVSIDELVGFAKGMKDKAKIINPNVGTLVDTCGTGGDYKGIINVSTGAAIIISATGIPIAKHGNYSISSKSGSANVLEALGYNLNLAPEYCQKMIENEDFGFLFAPKFHPAMKKVAHIREQIKERTIFNLLGPLCNPANANIQLIGVYNRGLCKKFCYALKELGVTRAFVVHGSGLDEISNIGETDVYELRNGNITSYRISPEDFGFRRYRLNDILGSSPKENAKYLRDIFNGVTGARRDILVLNAGAGIYLGNGASSLEEGIKKAEKTLNNHAASRKLSEIVASSNSY